MFKERRVKRIHDTVTDLGYENLIVSGCSFTHNSSGQECKAWPYHLRDIGGFEQVYDCSFPGAGNSHIANSLQWCLETTPVNPLDSLVIVMWSGHDRDDMIVPRGYLRTEHSVEYNYTSTVSTGITGGLDGHGNTRTALSQLAQQKNAESRSIENFLYINGMYQYLRAKKYKAIFLNFLEGPSRTKNFDIVPHLPNQLQTQYLSLFAPIVDLHRWGVKYDFLEPDDLHVNVAGHLDWTRKILHPYLVDNHSN